ncbi:MAG: CoA ester lyase [Alphaproteobacteria bacterium]|nr:CoA ester lyase [Alphaproteobacteria bacterium]
MSNANQRDRRPPALRRSWLFVPGAEREMLLSGPASQADVLIQEMEDFVPRGRRGEARALCGEVVAAWKAAQAVAGVRINPFWDGGCDDLEAVMAAAPHLVALPKVSTPEQVRDLDRAVTDLEDRFGLPSGSTELLPNIESAQGLMQTHAIAVSSPRVTACLVASEDMAADLGAERGRDGQELAYVRARFHLECVAAGVVSVDCPYTWSDEAGVEAEARTARRLGYTAKSAVMASHAVVVNRILTPSQSEVDRAGAMVTAFERARADGVDRVEVDGNLIEVPSVHNARRLLERARAFGVIEG